MIPRSNYTVSKPLTEALAQPSGARFYRCALQVNPFAYLSRYSKPTPYGSEDEYNAAIVDACLDEDIEVIAVTDHYRAEESHGLLKAAREAGIFAFGGFEAHTKDGVHFLCIFDPAKDGALERFIGECGVHDESDLSPSGTVDAIELLGCSKKWGAVCIAAHVTSEKGLLKQLSGQPRIKAKTSPSFG